MCILKLIELMIRFPRLLLCFDKIHIPRIPILIPSASNIRISVVDLYVNIGQCRSCIMSELNSGMLGDP